MPTTYLILLLILISANYSTGQSTLKISGKVIDEESKEAISFASISIEGKPIGTVTNVDGAFDFFIPSQYASDTLIISHVGYKSFKRKIVDFPNTDQIISLKTMPFLLKELVINEKKLTGKEIVSKAIRNLTKNYSTKPFCLEGFFREIEEENGKYVLLSEAALEICDQHFDGKPKSQLQESVDIKEMRTSVRYSGQGNRSNIGHSLNDLVENNDVRYNRGMLDTSANQFSLDTITLYNDRPVYGVSMANHTDRGMLYIDTETFGILKISMERKSQDSNTKYYQLNTNRGGLKAGRVWFRFSVEFELYMNTLYPRRMHESEYNEIYDPKTRAVKIASTETLEFIVTTVYPGKENKEAKKLKYGMTLKMEEYHKDFWKTYNTLKLTPIDEKLIQDLEKEISLQEQFEKKK